MKFTKMEGLGNTFLVTKGPHRLTHKKVKELCGNQVDGLIVVSPKGIDEVRMQYWNADGSVARMCGNGLRCTAYYAVMNHMVDPGEFTVETDAGKLKVSYSGKPEDQIDTQIGKVQVNPGPVTLYDKKFYLADVGNPHAIAFVENLETAPVESIGKKVETNRFFPDKTNVEFVQVLPEGRVSMRVWERGVGETKACGTGIASVAQVVSQLKGLPLPLEVSCPGGIAKVWEDEDGYTRIRASCGIID
jgi:diaminopimelate epimerase